MVQFTQKAHFSSPIFEEQKVLMFGKHRLEKNAGMFTGTHDYLYIESRDLVILEHSYHDLFVRLVRIAAQSDSISFQTFFSYVCEITQTNNVYMGKTVVLHDLLEMIG